MLDVGAQAPDFELPSTTGATTTLSSFQGRPVVLYFYPEDHTIGCTMEARTFRAYFESLGYHDVAILGVSQDNMENHCSFQGRHKLPFELLSDEDGAVHDLYGAWRTTRFTNQRRPRRCTYLIGPDGRIAKAYAKVQPMNHAPRVLKDVERIGHDAGWFAEH